MSIHTITDIKRKDANKCQVLGFNKKGQQLLKQNKDQPIYTRFGDLPDFLKEIEIKSKALYNSVLTTPLKESEIIRYAG